MYRKYEIKENHKIEYKDGITISGLKDHIIPIILYCILREILRYNMLCKAEGNKIVTVIVVIVFITMDITNSIYFSTFNLGILIFPIISKSENIKFKTGFIIDALVFLL